MISNEMLSAYIDGELAPAEMDAVRAAIARDELLAARLRQFERVDRMIAGFGAAIDSQPLPAAVLRQLGLAGNGPLAQQPAPAAAAAIVPLPARRRLDWRYATGLAAGLVFALTVGLQFGRSGGSDADRLAEVAAIGPVTAATPLHHALETLASDQSYVDARQPALRITPVLSFVSTTAAVCREFEVDAGTQAARGVACREGAGWKTLRVSAIDPPAAANSYATASAGSDTGFDAFVDGLIAGDPLAADAEARLLARGWRSGQ